MVHSDFPGHAGGKPRSGAPDMTPRAVEALGTKSAGQTAPTSSRTAAVIPRRIRCSANQPGRLASFGRNLNSVKESRPLKAGLSHNGPVQVVSRGA
jgi:hypothetical protein